ncbi:outer membrane homotrimeric porin [Desulfovibrio sp. OttesenSCG-928-C14]|nr:outer membrane homotrimeric porin [Desulfovibrio sp. OttesenSCG-928-C14]
MKRFFILLLALALVPCFGGLTAVKAEGLKITVKGQWDFSFGRIVNEGFNDSANRSLPGALRPQYGRPFSDESFLARQRVRTQIDFISSEYLKAVLLFEIGEMDWGVNQVDARDRRGGSGAFDFQNVDLGIRRAYLDWVIPNTEVSVRMGLQDLKLPSTPMGSPVFDTDVAGIVVSAPITGWLSATALWMRPFACRFDANGNPGSGNSQDTDIFGIILPMSFADSKVNLTPWFMYGSVIPASGFYDYVYNSQPYQAPTPLPRNPRTSVLWAGAHLEWTPLAPLTFNLEAIYGYLHPVTLDGFGPTVIPLWGSHWAETQHQSSRIGTSGWYIGATLDYQLGFMTPGIFAWWASGDKKNAWYDGKHGRLPVLGNDGGSFGPTSFGSAGYYGISQRKKGGAIMGTGTGTWGVGIQLADISFIENLKHTLRLAYYRGTNSSALVKDGGGFFGEPTHTNAYYFQYTADGLYLTDKDSVLEVNFDHQYKIYENLTATLELGWLQLKTDKGTWIRYWPYPAARSSKFNETENSWKAQLSLRYSF